MKFHKVSNLFPMMSKDEYEALKADISVNGQIEPIWIYQDQIIDGRNRYNACKELGVEPKFKTWSGKGSLVEFVVSLNLHRRHLSSTQKATIAVDMLPMLGEETREKQKLSEGRGKKVANSLATLSDKEANKQAHENTATEQAAKLTGTNRQYVSDAKKIAKKRPDLFEKMRSGEATISEAKREIVKSEKKPPPKLSGRYSVLYADPPWKYGNAGIINDDNYGHVERHYPSMSIKELCALDIRGVVEDNAVLFLWVTSPLLEECFPVVKAWGFKYKTSFVWDKVKHNFGHYNSVRHEFLLVCVRGSFTPENNKLFDSVVQVERTKEHSEKPEEFRNIIETLYPSANKIELFARKKIKGWSIWGNEDV